MRAKLLSLPFAVIACAISGLVVWPCDLLIAVLMNGCYPRQARYSSFQRMVRKLWQVFMQCWNSGQRV